MLKKLKSEIVTSIKNRKVNVFFLFLISAFIILIFTKLSKQYTDTIIFDIEKANVPKTKVVLNDSATYLQITLKTHGFKWLNYYFKTPKITIDFSNDVYKTDSVFVWSKSEAFINNTQLDNQVQLLNIAPDTLRFKYGENAVKKVPVLLNSSIDFAPGYDVLNAYELQPDSIEIVGPDIIVFEINYLETDTIKRLNVSENLTETVKLQLPKNRNELKFSKNAIILNAQVEKFTEGNLKLPVTLVNVPKGVSLNFFPKEVTVSYYVSLSNFNEVRPNDFKLVCDYNKVSENQSYLIPELVKIPKLIKNARIHQQRIEFIIKK